MPTEAPLDEPAPVELLGLRFAAPTRESALDFARRAVAAGRPTAISAVNAPKVVRLPEHRALREALLAADLLLPDGASLVWAARTLGVPLPERVTGADLLDDLLAAAAARGWRVYLLGATEAVNERAARAVAARGVAVVGRHHGYFDDEDAIEEAIEVARPDLLVVALETPRKEVLTVRWRDRLRVPVTIGVGGALDVLAGARRRAPGAIQRLGMEWAWRTLGRPPRDWPGAFAVNAAFARIVARERRSPGSYARSLATGVVDPP